MITYTAGDATRPIGDGDKIIAHICNDVGAWGRGFVVAISKRWLSPEQNYRSWYKGKMPSLSPFQLGQTQFVQVEDDIFVANMVAQHNFGSAQGPPIRYDALEKCLLEVAKLAKALEASVHMPRIGCGLAGGKWEEVEPIIQRTLCAAKRNGKYGTVEYGIPITVYDFSPTT